MDTNIGENQHVSHELRCGVEEPEFCQHHPLVFQIKNPIAIKKNEIKQ